ncbi:MAG: hypothetical protein R6U39_03935 [Candidatus Aegiribacteria sp.]
MRSSFRLFARVFSGLLAVFIFLGTILMLFMGRMETLEGRRNSLLLAGRVFTRWDDGRPPVTGVFDSTAAVGGETYRIRRIVYDIPPDMVEMRVIVGRRNDTGIELIRRYFDNDE